MASFGAPRAFEAWPDRDPAPENAEPRDAGELIPIDQWVIDIDTIGALVLKYEPKFKGRIVAALSLLVKKMKSYECSAEEDAFMAINAPGLGMLNDDASELESIQKLFSFDAVMNILGIRVALVSDFALWPFHAAL